MVKLKDLVVRVKNKSNQQTNFSLKKKAMKQIDISEDDLLNIRLDKMLEKGLE